VLKAAVWKVTGSLPSCALGGCGWANSGLLRVAFGIAVDWFTGQLVNGLWIVLLGWFSIRNASAYDRVTSLQEALQLVATDAMNQDFRVVDADQTLRQFADLYLETTTPQVYFAASDGRYRGMVSIDQLRLVERSQWESQTHISCVRWEIPTVAESTPLSR